MKITSIKVENYKSLRDTECRLSDFVCVIGENNAGKSSLLQAILLFINGNRLQREAYYEANRDIVITVRLTGVNDGVLGLLTEDHRFKLAPEESGTRVDLASSSARRSTCCAQ